MLSEIKEKLSIFSLLGLVVRGANLLPTPPPRRIFSDRFNKGFLKRRCKEMQKYFNKLIEVENVLSDNAFHLFVQTDLSTSELTDYFNGELPEKIIAEAWSNMGHVHSNCLLSKHLPEEPQEIVMNEDDLLTSSDDSASATPRYSPEPATSSDTSSSHDEINDKDKTSSMDTVSSSIESMTDLGRLGLPARAVVEMSPTLVVGEPAWQSQSEGSGSGDITRLP
ncbi:sorting nexin-11 [Elysia marginata]|uniref:Sorting nexin-11 n=1 Tax=Elysia marginata TaxID=1093978 RepID=A0AAV4IN61_9GAST|nr:sorting nexin-11 [Elysia marginata]